MIRTNGNIPFIASSNLRYRLPKGATHRIQVPIAGAFDSSITLSTSAGLAITFVVVDIQAQGIVVDVTVGAGVADGLYPLYVKSGGVYTNGDLLGSLATNALSRLQVATGGSLITIGDNTIAQSNIGAVDFYEVFDHFDQTALNGWSSSTSGTASQLDMTQLSERTAVGICRVITGTSTNGRAAFIRRVNLIQTFTDGSLLLYKTKIRVEALSDGTARSFFLQFGFINSNTTGNQNNQINFLYDPQNIKASGTSGVQNWVLQNRANAVNVNVINTGVAVVLGVWVRFTIVIDTINATAKAFINDIEVASIPWNGLTGVSSNLPMTGVGFESSFGHFSQNAAAGATATNATRVDYIYVYKNLSEK
jgi:hypothetical protein